MPSFGKRSKKNLSEAHPLLQELFNAVVKKYDCAVIEGYRGEEEQNKYYHAGQSKLKYPQSKHNKQPSLAVDVVPYPIDWKDYKRFYHFAGYVKGVADTLGIDIRYGTDWDGDNDFKDQTFHDLPHFELKSTTRSKVLPQQISGAEKSNKTQHLPDAPSEDDINDILDDIDKDLGL